MTLSPQRRGVKEDVQMRKGFTCVHLFGIWWPSLHLTIEEAQVRIGRARCALRIPQEDVT